MLEDVRRSVRSVDAGAAHECPFHERFCGAQLDVVT